jgi:tetratricopeptide (TPR) repeat protein
MKLVATLLLLLSSTAFGQSISGQISRIGDSTHLEFKGRSEWTYDDPVQSGDKLTFLLPAFDVPTETSLRGWNCTFVKEVAINKNAPDGKYEVIFTLADKNVETFNYLTDEPSRLIIDFYRRADTEQKVNPAPATPTPANKTLANSPGPKTGAAQQGTATSSSRDEYTKIDKGGRKPASNEILVGPGLPVSEVAVAEAELPTRGIFDGGDPNYDRFGIKDYQIKEESIIASQQNIYIKFPMLKVKIERFGELYKNAPEYEIKPKDSKENKEARFLAKLHLDKKTASFLEAYEYFQKQYPTSEYDEIIRNMKTEILIHRYLEKNDATDYDLFRSEYRYLLDKYPDSVLAERNLLLLSYSALEKGDSAEALQDLQRYEQKYPNSEEIDHVRMASAEALVILNKPQDALNIYAQIEKSAKNKSLGIEAAYRMGDVHILAREYTKAVAAYERAMKTYPAFKKVFPNAQYNTSESRFWLGEYKKSLQDFVEYLKLYPTHSHGGFALTRVGELLQILGADQSRVVGAFIESYFRFPRSQGSEVARIRMLSQGLKGMKEKEERKALEEIEEIAKNSKLPRMDEFVTLMVADGLSRRGEFKDSLERLVTYYQAHPTTTSLPVFKGRILRNISDVMKDEVEKNNFIGTLNFYGKYAKTWLKGSDRIDIPFYQARAFEQSGVYAQAEKSYIEIRNELNKIRNTKEEKKRKVYENLPNVDQVNLRIAAVAVEQRQYREALTSLKSIKTGLTGAENVERVQIGARVAEQLGDLKQAISYLHELVKNWQGQPELVAQPHLSLAELYLKTENLDAAGKSLAEIEGMKIKGTDVSDEVWAKTLELRGEHQFQNGQRLAAVETFSKLLDEYETKRPLSGIRYRAGRILYDEGDVRGAEKMWSGLDEKTGEFYKKLAQEKLQQSEWQDSYKKYMDRIPAAEGMK